MEAWSLAGTPAFSVESHDIASIRTNRVQNSSDRIFFVSFVFPRCTKLAIMQSIFNAAARRAEPESTTEMVVAATVG